MVCFGILFFIQEANAQNELPLPKGKNITEWQAISSALMKDERYDEALIYLDKIIEQEPNNLRALSNKAGILIHLNKIIESLEISNKVLEIDSERVSTLQNKGVALRMLKQYEAAFDTFNKIRILEPENESIKKQIARTLAEMPTIETTNSPYAIHLQVKITDSKNNLIGVIESSNARYLPSKFFEQWWNDVDNLGMITHQDDNTQFYQFNEILSPTEDHLGMYTWEVQRGGFNIVLYQVFVPMVEFVGSEKLQVQWSIIKN
tara:strand:+ start:756 stop:1541 length:786 start_codon:yes stop_codon:yes gene_type:complete